MTSPRRPYRRSAVLLTCAAVVLTTAACGGRDAASPPTPVPTSAPSASPPPRPTAPPAAPSPTASVPRPTRPATPPAAPTTTRQPAALSRCTTGQLTAKLGPGEGAAGSVYRPLVFTNTGRRACELRGFPGVSYVAGDDGHQVGPAAAMVGGRGPQVRIEPGRSASAALQLANVGNFDPGVCRPTAVRGLRVYPPGDKAALFVPAEGTGCAGTPPGPQLVVRTITAG
jgi:hypothetical protein